MQVVLVRRDQVNTHRRLGMFRAGLASVMVAAGVMTAIMTEQIKFGTAASDPLFLSVTLGSGHIDAPVTSRT